MKNQKNMQFPYLFPDISPNNSLNQSRVNGWSKDRKSEKVEVEFGWMRGWSCVCGHVVSDSSSSHFV